MPYSSHEGKEFVRAYMTRYTDILYVLDIGPGAGTYFELLDKPLAVEHWTAIEIWAPYVEQFNLRSKYDEVIIGDAVWVDWDRLGHPDLTILGDVIEHMTAEQAIQVIEKAVARSRFVVISTPIIHYPQGAEMGNPYETHRITFTPESIREFLDGYDILAYDEGDVVGTYIIKGDEQ